MNLKKKLTFIKSGFSIYAFNFHSKLTIDVIIGSAEYCSEHVCLCACVCLSVHDHISGTARQIFTTKFFVHVMAVARYSSGGVVIRYVFPVLWMTSCLHIG